MSAPGDAIAAIGGAAASGVEGVANGYFNYKTAELNQKYYEKNQRANFLYNMEAQKLAAPNEVQGLRDAGLSPVLANGSQGMSVAAGTQGTMQPPHISAANMLLTAQLKNLDAQTDKIKADTKSQEIKNERDTHEDKSTSEGMASTFRDLASRTDDPEVKAWLELSAEAAAKGEANVGDYNALLKTFDLVGKPEDIIQRKMDKKIGAWITEQRFHRIYGKTMDDPFVKAIASVDARQSDLLAEQAAKLISERKGVDESTKLTESQIRLTDEQVKQVKAAAEQMENTNVMEFINKGDYGRALLAMVLQVWQGLAGRGASYVK